MKMFFVRDLSGRNYTCEMNQKQLIDDFKDDEEMIDWIESACEGSNITVDAKDITCKGEEEFEINSSDPAALVEMLKRAHDALSNCCNMSHRAHSSYGQLVTEIDWWLHLRND